MDLGDAAGFPVVICRKRWKERKIKPARKGDREERRVRGESGRSGQWCVFWRWWGARNNRGKEGWLVFSGHYAGNNGGNGEGEEWERKMVVRRREKWRERGEKNEGVVSGWLLAGVRGGKMGRGEEDDVGTMLVRRGRYEAEKEEA
ncbi:hypothetical protein HAX54_018369, partial [Datura stramonium]|nr:hypothetical protein [Datura stramonium]